MIDIDMHTHCRPYSPDGVQSVQELVDKAKSIGIKTLALTDHDCVDGVNEAAILCKKEGITFVPGVELTTILTEQLKTIPLNTVIHILGYNIDCDKFRSEDAASPLKQEKQERLSKLLDYLRAQGYYLPETQCYKTESDIRKQLIKSGSFIDNREAKQFLKSKEIIGKFPPIGYSIPDGIQFIHKLGGVAIAAHICRPSGFLTLLERDQYLELAWYLLKNNIDGIEVFHYHNFQENAVDSLLDFCQKNSLLVSIGSDRHDAHYNSEMNYFRFADDLMAKYGQNQVTIEQFIKRNLRNYT